MPAKKLNYILLAAIVGLIAWIIFRKPEVRTVVMSDENSERIIKELRTDISDREQIIDSMRRDKKVVTVVQEKIKIVYREKYNFINASGITVNDSIVRADLAD